LAKITPAQMEQEQKKMLEQKYKFAPTAEEIKKRERRNMLNRGERPRTRRKSRFAE